MANTTCSIDDCDRDAIARGWCRRHYLRWHKYGDPTAWRNDPTPIAERFWAKVNRSEGCWPWTAGTNRAGYGRIRLGGRGGGVELAHRLSWKLHTGTDPGDLCVLHKCDNPPCVNPEHLFLGTPADNTQDMVRKNRTKSPLTPNQVLAILTDHRTGRLAAEAFNVSYDQVKAIRSGRTWNHVTGLPRKNRT